MATAPTATPTPTPAFAPLERPFELVSDWSESESKEGVDKAEVVFWDELEFEVEVAEAIAEEVEEV